MKQQMLEGQDTDDDKLAWRVEAELRLRLDELRRTEGASSAQLESEVTQLQVMTEVDCVVAVHATLAAGRLCFAASVIAGAITMHASSLRMTCPLCTLSYSSESIETVLLLTILTIPTIAGSATLLATELGKLI